MIEQGIGREYLEQMTAAKEAMLEVGKRLVKHGKIVFKGDELKILNEAMDIHEAQLDNTRAIDVDRAAMEVERRVRNKINSTSVMRELREEEERMAA